MIDELESRMLYTECERCDNGIEEGLFDVTDNTMYLECPSCGSEITVWNWYDDWEKP